LRRRIWHTVQFRVPLIVEVLHSIKFLKKAITETVLRARARSPKNFYMPHNAGTGCYIRT
jgi:hypothetical protein